MKASIIIPCYNAEKHIDACLDSVFKQENGDFEVLVIDDCSKDNTAEKLKRHSYRKNFRLFFNKKNLGPGAARNFLIKQSEGEIILLLDSDCIVEQDWVSGHISYQGKGHPIIGGAIEGIYYALWGKIDNYSSWFTSIPNSGDYHVKRIHLPTTNLSIRRDVIEKVGYFKEDVRTGEDAEWCHRAEMKKFNLFFTSRITVKHLNRNKLRDVLLHEKSFGAHAVSIRSKSKMPYNWAIPKNIYAAFLLTLPIAFCYSIRIVIQWCKKGNFVLLYFPFIFLVKVAYSMGLISACYHEKGWKL